MKLVPTITTDAAAAQTWDAVVIGGGPAGALAARLLALQQRRVLLVERKTFPRPKVCGGCLSAAGVAILQQASLLSAVRAAGAQPLRQLQVRSGSAAASLALPGGLSISRAALDAVLVSQAIDAGAHFLPGVTARVDYDQGYRVRLEEEGTSPSAPRTVSTRVILVADGLGHPSLRATNRFAERIAPRSRIGAACVLPAGILDLPRATIRMHVGAGGYVGVVQVEEGQVCMAAALAPEFVRANHGVSFACAAILRGATSELQNALHEQTWLGAPQLTRQTLTHADDNVLLLGDALGYVEPFTGEGMTWALMSAVEVQPFLLRAFSGKPVAAAWSHHCQRMAAKRQRWCRAIAYGLRTPWLTNGCLRIVDAAPALAHPVVHWITQRRIPELAQVTP